MDQTVAVMCKVCWDNSSVRYRQCVWRCMYEAKVKAVQQNQGEEKYCDCGHCLRQYGGCFELGKYNRGICGRCSHGNWDK